jgi:hypothetical protein
MNSTVTLSWFGVSVIFFGGIAVGWLAAKAAAGGSVETGLSAGDPSTPGVVNAAKTIKTRNLALRCRCGAIWKFAESTGPLPPETEPIPTGDTFVCKQCGKSIDLKAERQLEAETLANLNPRNRG